MTPSSMLQLDDAWFDNTEPRAIETYGPNTETPPRIHYYPGSMLVSGGEGDDLSVFRQRPQRSRAHEDDVYFTDARNMTRVINLLAHAERSRTLSEKHLKEIQWRIGVTHPELPF